MLAKRAFMSSLMAFIWTMIVIVGCAILHNILEFRYYIPHWILKLSAVGMYTWFFIIEYKMRKD